MHYQPTWKHNINAQHRTPPCRELTGIDPRSPRAISPIRPILPIGHLRPFPEATLECLSLRRPLCRSLCRNVSWNLCCASSPRSSSSAVCVLRVFAFEFGPRLRFQPISNFKPFQGFSTLLNASTRYTYHVARNTPRFHRSPVLPANPSARPLNMFRSLSPFSSSKARIFVSSRKIHIMSLRHHRGKEKPYRRYTSTRFRII